MEDGYQPPSGESQLQVQSYSQNPQRSAKRDHIRQRAPLRASERGFGVHRQRRRTAFSVNLHTMSTNKGTWEAAFQSCAPFAPTAPPCRPCGRSALLSGVLSAVSVCVIDCVPVFLRNS